MLLRKNHHRRGTHGRALAIVGIVLLSLVAVGAAESQHGKLNLRRIAGNVYMIDNSGPGRSGPASFGHGNSAVLVGVDGLLLVDDDALPDPRFLITGLQSRFHQPVRYVIETACGGLAALSHQVGTVVSSERARQRVEQRKCWRGYPIVLPTVTFRTEITLFLDGEEVRVVALPTGKTDGDAVVYFKHANVVATGDTFVSSVLPTYSKYAGGNILGVPEELRRIAGLVPVDAKVIPGHGPISSVSAMVTASRALDDLKRAVAAQMAEGKTLDQIRKMNLLEPWKDLVGADTSYIKYLYDRLSGPPESEFQLSPDEDASR